jgi:hypothetical protein
MATTTNFGWETPDDTDLVKDGALAMRTLGNSIDTSFVDLKGGTTGQILSKASNTDLDYTWINNDQGDITAVTAGTGLTGGGTSGSVTLTNDMATTITAAGDIVVGTGSGTYDNLPIGTTGQVLTADTTVSPYKVKWATAASGSTFSGVAGTQEVSVANNTLTTVNFTAEYFDTDAYHSNTTNTSRFTVPSGKAGYYMISMLGEWQDNSSGRRLVNFYKNGSTKLATLNIAANGANPLGCNLNYVANLAEGDYIEVKLQQTSGSTITWYMFTDAHQFSMYYIGA